ncbi:MAG: hypothetical protein AB8B69_24070 [Chitinophagales bacterium]
MPLNFTPKGHLSPAKEISSNENELADYFVDRISNSNTRKQLFDSYLNLMLDFRQKISSDFTVWINGSFVTQKTHPNDIDLVIFLEAFIFQDKQVELNSLKQKYQEENLDLYFVKAYPESHKRHFWYVSKQIEWRHLFTKTRKQKRTGKSFSKGFSTISYHDEEQFT